ncbi:MAG: hypothetical protein ABIK73_06075 [candidate division WOR-3 bacterium]
MNENQNKINTILSYDTFLDSERMLLSVAQNIMYERDVKLIIPMKDKENVLKDYIDAIQNKSAYLSYINTYEEKANIEFPFQAKLKYRVQFYVDDRTNTGEYKNKWVLKVISLSIFPDEQFDYDEFTEELDNKFTLWGKN